ncbi:LOW QUALITY PROTEIN: serine protease FAM111A-like [Spinachia spinachia]
MYHSRGFADGHVVIQLGAGDMECTVATHFPCSCIKDDETLILSQNKEVEASQDQRDQTVHSRDKYSVFYIDTVGGQNAKTKSLFKSVFKKYLCVYGKKGITVQEALMRDGRFPDLSGFNLSNNDDPQCVTVCTQRVDGLHGKKFKCLPLGSNPGSPKTKEEAGSQSKTKEDKVFAEAFNLRRKDFGKIQHTFSEVHRVKELGKSVCKVTVENGPQGTGFVLFDNFILTNAHLFKGMIEEGKLRENIDYVKPEPHTDKHYFELAQRGICYRDDGLDYAVLEINNPNPVPPGLLKRFGPKPADGHGCIVGHPAGGLKNMDPICIIEKEETTA